MILLVKSLNNSILGKLGFKHWYFVDTKKNLVYSYDYEIKWDKFVNGEVKTFTFSAYEKEVSKWIEITKLPYFDLSKYLDYSNENSTCMDFCLFVLNKEWIDSKLYNTAIESYFEVKKNIKRVWMSHFLIFLIWFFIWIISIVGIIMLLFDINFVNI